jgi:hypothetical protein
MATIRWTTILLALTLGAGCGGGDGGTDATAAPDLTDLASADDARIDAPDDPGGPLPLCACPLVPAGGTCRSCSSLDNHCETRDGVPWAVHCVLVKGCLAAEDCTASDPAATCDDGACVEAPLPEPEPDVQELAEPDVVETIEPGSRQVGDACKDSADCGNGMTCVSGQYTMAHCNPMCATVDDCNAAFPGGNAQCAALSGGSVCIWFCGAFGGGATCPGDLQCDGASCG